MTTTAWHCRSTTLTFARGPLLLGIVNVTPDSFSDGGQFFDPSLAVDHALRLVADGADILDVGGESTRPGSDGVTEAEELRRVMPVVQLLAKRTTIPISVDTSKASVARACLDAGAVIINDVTGLLGDPDMPAVAAQTGAGLIVMHMQGTPATMQLRPQYEDVVREVAAFFEERLHTLEAVGIARNAIAFDPGIGFGKTKPHNLQLLANLHSLRGSGRPLCVGVSRKGFIGSICNRPPLDRVAGSLAVASLAAAENPDSILRVHDIAPTRDVVSVTRAILDYRVPSPETA